MRDEHKVVAVVAVVVIVKQKKKDTWLKLGLDFDWTIPTHHDI